MTVTVPGGIDLNTKDFKLKIQRNGGELDLFNVDNSMRTQIDGLSPEIIGMRQARMEDFPFLSSFNYQNPS